MLKLRHVTGGYENHLVIKDMNLSISKGEFFGILGPNGSGKTTLLKMISGLISPTSGSIMVNDKKVADFTRKEIARKMAVFSQLSAHSFPYSVRETVALGRYAHHEGLFQSWSYKDEEVLEKVMEQTNTTAFADRFLQELSGGEQQRVFLAQALAQQPDLLLLDEPTNHLDLAYQKDILDLLKDSVKGQGLTVISIFHDLNLASLYCDRLLLLDDGRCKSLDKPDDVLTESLVEEVYKTEVKKYPHPEIAKPQIHLIPDGITKSSEDGVIDASMLQFNSNNITLTSPQPLRTLSSGVCGAGIGWNNYFVNRHVPHDYICEDHQRDMKDYLKTEGFNISRTVGMMTAVYLKDVSYGIWDHDDFSVFTVVTAGIGNATDATRAIEQKQPIPQGTINIWLFVNGKLKEEAFIQAIVTATEAKAQMLHEMGVKDKKTDTLATGTSTDSILVAATQQGKTLSYAGTATGLGTVIGQSVYTQTRKAIQNYMAEKW